MVAGGKIDLFITDIKMPGRDGYELAQDALNARPGLKALLVTGYSSQPLLKAISDAGIGVLYKPFDIDRLTEMATRLVS
ncbi:MAG: response regulator [Alphaproteobacteria bacterium]